MRNQEPGRAGSDALSRLYPTVEAMAIQMDFITPQQQTLDQETREFGLEDACDFTASCPGRCDGHGLFDFGAKVSSLVNQGKTEGEARGTCQQTIFPGSQELCGMQLACRISVTYRPE